VSYHIAHSGEAHVSAKNLVKLCIKDTVSCVLGDKHLKAIKKIPFQIQLFQEGYQL
jgi:hypothetical protein